MYYVDPNVHKYQKYAHEFKKIFGTTLRPYFDFVTGFDVVKFDRTFVKSPDGSSMEEAIRKDYGDSGVRMIRKLLQ